MTLRTYRLGRHPDCDIVYSHRSVSRQHAEIIIVDVETLFVADCGSSWGTFAIEGGDWTPIRQVFLRKADRIRFGEQQSSFNKLLSDIRDLRERTITGELSSATVTRNPRSGKLSTY